MISLEQVQQLDIRVKKAVAAVKTLSAENSALKQRIAELQNEEAARAADEQQLEVSLQGVLDVLDEVDEETSEVIADDHLGMGMDDEDNSPRQPEDDSAEDADSGLPGDKTANAGSDETGGTAAELDTGGRAGKNDRASEVGGGSDEAADKSAPTDAAAGGGEGQNPARGVPGGEAPRGLGEAVSPDQGIGALKGGGAKDETKTADQGKPQDTDPGKENSERPEDENPVQTEFDIF